MKMVTICVAFLGDSWGYLAGVKCLFSGSKSAWPFDEEEIGNKWGFTRQVTTSFLSFVGN